MALEALSPEGRALGSPALSPGCAVLAKQQYRIAFGQVRILFGWGIVKSWVASFIGSLHWCWMIIKRPFTPGSHKVMIFLYPDGNYAG